MANPPKKYSRDKIQSFIDKHSRGKSPLNADFFIGLSQETGVPVELMLSQALHESHFGTRGRAAKTKNMFNVGNTTPGDTLSGAEQEKYNRYMGDWESGARNYANLIRDQYLKGRDLNSLLTPGGFVNRAGNRYATAPHYESVLRKTISSLGDIYSPFESVNTPRVAAPTMVPPTNQRTRTQNTTNMAPRPNRQSRITGLDTGGISASDLLYQRFGKDITEVDEGDIQQLGKEVGFSRRDTRRAIKGLRKFQELENADIKLNQYGSRFNTVFSEKEGEGTPAVQSGKRTGMRDKLSPASLLGLGRNVNYLAGMVSGLIGKQGDSNVTDTPVTMSPQNIDLGQSPMAPVTVDESEEGDYTPANGWPENETAEEPFTWGLPTNEEFIADKTKTYRELLIESSAAALGMDPTHRDYLAEADKGEGYKLNKERLDAAVQAFERSLREGLKYNKLDVNLDNDYLELGNEIASKTAESLFQDPLLNPLGREYGGMPFVRSSAVQTNVSDAELSDQLLGYLALRGVAQPIATGAGKYLQFAKSSPLWNKLIGGRNSIEMAKQLQKASASSGLSNPVKIPFLPKSDGTLPYIGNLLRRFRGAPPKQAPAVAAKDLLSRQAAIDQAAARMAEESGEMGARLLRSPNIPLASEMPALNINRNALSKLSQAAKKKFDDAISWEKNSFQWRKGLTPERQKEVIDMMKKYGVMRNGGTLPKGQYGLKTPNFQNAFSAANGFAQMDMPELNLQYDAAGPRVNKNLWSNQAHQYSAFQPLGNQFGPKDLLTAGRGEMVNVPTGQLDLNQRTPNVTAVGGGPSTPRRGLRSLLANLFNRPTMGGGSDNRGMLGSALETLAVTAGPALLAGRNKIKGVNVPKFKEIEGRAGVPQDLPRDYQPLFNRPETGSADFRENMFAQQGVDKYNKDAEMKYNLTNAMQKLKSKQDYSDLNRIAMFNAQMGQQGQLTQAELDARNQIYNQRNMADAIQSGFGNLADRWKYSQYADQAGQNQALSNIITNPNTPEALRQATAQRLGIKYGKKGGKLTAKNLLKRNK